MDRKQIKKHVQRKTNRARCSYNMNSAFSYKTNSSSLFLFVEKKRKMKRKEENTVIFKHSLNEKIMKNGNNHKEITSPFSHSLP